MIKQREITKRFQMKSGKRFTELEELVDKKFSLDVVTLFLDTIKYPSVSKFLFDKA